MRRNIFNGLINRIYSDYLMSSRLDEYERIIINLIEADYTFITIKDYCEKLSSNNLKEKKIFINRHDIDTDLSTAKRFFELEKKYKVKATYYFRQSTLDINFMKEIESYGSEASYHYEEISIYAKHNHIKNKDSILSDITQIRDLFKKNFLEIEEKLGYKMKTVCSHGDFTNRALGLSNSEILKDKDLRKDLGIICEAYDKELMDAFDIYISDRPYPEFYFPESIFNFIGNTNTICMLTHPRKWKANILENIKEDLRRLREGLQW